MARAVRIEYAGAIYHVMSRGDRGEKIWQEEKDREKFLELLGKVCGQSDIEEVVAVAPFRFASCQPQPQTLPLPSASLHCVPGGLDREAA